jgi:hypothetical protein
MDTMPSLPIPTPLARPRRARSGKHLTTPISKDEAKYLKIDWEGGWIAIGLSMLESPAYRAMSRAAHLVLSRLMAEHIKHSRKENGRLAVTYDEFVLYGVGDRKQVSAALKELHLLGFVKCTDRGRRPYGSDKGKAATYRLTFDAALPEKNRYATNEWRRWNDMEMVKAMLAGTRKRRKSKAVPEETTPANENEPDTRASTG